jgi:uncharacterized cupin superfamily protein
VANVFEPRWDGESDGLRRARVGEQLGTDHLGISVYELEPGQSMVFHYHLQNEELLIVLRGTVSLRTPEGWRDLREGDAVVFPRGERGAHGFENRTRDATRVLLLGELNGPNVSVYPDTNEIGIFDAPLRHERRFGARFRLDDAQSGYGGVEPTLPDYSSPR